MANVVIFNNTEITIRLNTYQDMSAATGKEIHFRKPDGTTGEWSADADGEYLTYTTADDDIPEDGTWAFQAVAVVNSKLVKGAIVKQNIQMPIKTT